MPIPERLGPEAAGLYSTIAGMLTQGIGADRAFRILRGVGDALPRATVRQIAGEIRQTLGFSQALARQDPAAIVPARLIGTNSKLRMTGYLTVATASMRDTETGFTWQRFFSYTSPTPPVPQEVFSQFADAVDTGTDYTAQEVLGMGLFSVQQGAG